jgi:hypothetical protein
MSRSGQALRAGLDLWNLKHALIQIDPLALNPVHRNGIAGSSFTIVDTDPSLLRRKMALNRVVSGTGGPVRLSTRRANRSPLLRRAIFT